MANKERYVNYTITILGGGEGQIALCGMKAQRKLDQSGVYVDRDKLKFLVFMSMHGIEKNKRLKSMRIRIKKLVNDLILEDRYGER